MMMQPRRAARELALLSVSQLPSHPDRISEQALQDLVLAAIRTLTTEVRDALETASSELSRGSEHLLSSEIRAADFKTSKLMVKDAIDITQSAINRLGVVLEMPEFVQLGKQDEVRSYAIDILVSLCMHHDTLNKILNNAMVDWQMNRLARIDQDILRIAVIEFLHLGLPKPVAINEAVELAKRYSSEDGHRFINGVLRRVSDRTEVNLGA